MCAADRLRRSTGVFDSEAAAMEIADPAVWEAAHALNQATSALVGRQLAGRIGGEAFERELAGLLDGVDGTTREAARRLTRATEQALAGPPGRTDA